MPSSRNTGSVAGAEVVQLYVEDRESSLPRPPRELKGFEKVLLMYNPAIYETADVISTYVYRRGILSGEYSFAAAVGLFGNVVNLVLLVTFNRISRRFWYSAMTSLK